MYLQYTVLCETSFELICSTFHKKQTLKYCLTIQPKYPRKFIQGSKFFKNKISAEKLGVNILNNHSCFCEADSVSEVNIPDQT